MSVMNMGNMVQIAAGVLLLALIALVIYLGIRWLWPRNTELPIADLAMSPDIQVHPLAADHEEGTVAERPPGACSELVCTQASGTNIEMPNTGMANIRWGDVTVPMAEYPALVTIHPPVETDRRLEALTEANRHRSEEAREKAKSSRLAVIAGASSEETVTNEYGYANVKAMRRAWARYQEKKTD